MLIILPRSQLASLSSNKLVASFALRTAFNDFWMTKLYMFGYDQVEQILYRAGFKMQRTKRIKFFFYDSFVSTIGATTNGAIALSSL